MELLEGIMGRRSVRSYAKRAISHTDIETILKAGMSGPVCVNARDWAFLAVTDRETLERMADANGGPAAPLRRAALGILICGDLSRAFPPAKDYWIIDGAIAGQNMTLAARSLGIESVWLGTWPQLERVENQRKLFGLPEHIVPHSVLAFGYPASEGEEESPSPPGRKPKPEWEADRVHFERW